MFGMQLGIQHNLEYIIVVNWLELKTIVICLKLCAKWHCYDFLIVFDTFSHKGVPTWFVWNETRDTTLFCICYCVEMVRIESNIHILQITS